MTRVLTLVMSAFMVIGLMIIAPVSKTPISEPVSVAQAGNCSAPGICGRIHQRMGPGTQLVISYQYGCHSGSCIQTLYNGQNSEWYRVDADEFYVSPGGCGKLYVFKAQGSYLSFVGNKYGGLYGTWHKVNDNGTYWEVRHPC